MPGVDGERSVARGIQRQKDTRSIAKLASGLGWFVWFCLMISGRLPILGARGWIVVIAVISAFIVASALYNKVLKNALNR